MHEETISPPSHEASPKQKLINPGRWSPAEDAVLTAEYRKGASTLAIAAAIPGRTASAVDSRITTLSLPARYPGVRYSCIHPKELVAQRIIEMRAEGASYRQIAAALGVARCTVQRRADQIGLTATCYARVPQTPLMAARYAPRTERKCLACRNPFPSAGAGERLCRQCKERSAWRDGFDPLSGVFV